MSLVKVYSGFETACALQTCLNKNTYKPEKCDDRLRQLYLCCQRMYDDNSNGEKSEVTVRGTPISGPSASASGPSGPVPTRSGSSRYHMACDSARDLCRSLRLLSHAPRP
ncbi:hypothetical protein C8R43DRAFT_901051 [Mycena crocata]|nr:hypothetical protein C8R43DRAFT_901051 [Mycena crocata]